MLVHRNSDGFTLIEILIAVTIVALLSAGAIVGVPAIMKRVRTTTTTSTLKLVKGALDRYHMDIGIYPADLKELVEKPTDSKKAIKWGGPYLEGDIEDGWGQSIHYQKTPGAKRVYELYSDGYPEDPTRINVWDI